MRKPILTENIELLRSAFKKVRKHHSFEIIACVVLPEHFHIILSPEKIQDYPKIISAIKHYFSRNLDTKVDDLSESKIKKREKGVWHRRYFEHTIIDENDLNKHIDYVHYNPVKHGLVSKVKEWEYSSFHSFVKNGYYDETWGSTQNEEDFGKLYDD